MPILASTHYLLAAISILYCITGRFVLFPKLLLISKSELSSGQMFGLVSVSFAESLHQFSEEFEDCPKDLWPAMYR